jgi:putative ABC transport system permease protein
MNALSQDLRYALRLLRKSPGFTLVAVLSIALGIGATTAIFSVVNAVLLRPLPFAEDERLVVVSELIPKITSEPIPMPAHDTQLFAAAAAFEQSAAMMPLFKDVSGAASAERLQGLRVSPSLFPMLGVTPLRGRVFTAEEDRPGIRVAMISHALWQRQFNGDPALVGRTMLLNREPYEVIGVMPPDFAFPVKGSISGIDADTADFFIPVAFTEDELKVRGDAFRFTVMARLAPGVTVERANAEAQAIAKRIHAEYPPGQRAALDLRAAVQPLFEKVVGDSRRLLTLLFGAVALLLAIACANVANMLLNRATGRGRELAVRMALGAGRRRVVTQLLTESVLLALMGGFLGALLARAGTAMLVGFLPATLPRTGEIAVDANVLTFAITLSVLTGLLFGLAPALSASRGGAGGGLQGALRDAGKGMSSSARWNRVRQGLAVMELALALVLLAGAGLLLRSLLFVVNASPGFTPENTIAASLLLPEPEYAAPARSREFVERLQRDTASLPGVESVGAATDLPFESNLQRVVTPEPPARVTGAESIVGYAIVQGRYFESLGIPLHQGRLLTEADNKDSMEVAVVNDAFARKFFADRQSVIGARFKFGTLTGSAPWTTIVGVVGSIGKGGPDRAALPTTYQSVGQADFPQLLRRMSVVARVSDGGDPASLLSALRDRVRAIDPHLPLGGVKTMEMATAAALAPRRATAALVGVFAVSALLLAALGLYGVLAYAVGQRTQEFGIRLALGAEPRQVLELVLREGVVLALCGVGLGLALSAALGRTLASFLYGIGAYDPAVLIGVPLLLMVVALLACLVPARRAVTVDPMRTLRSE